MRYLFLLLLAGCAHPGQRMGRPMAAAGEASGKIGTGIIMMSGFNVVLVPFCVLSVPFYLAAYPMYYGGNAMAGDETEAKPFD